MRGKLNIQQYSTTPPSLEVEETLKIEENTQTVILDRLEKADNLKLQSMIMEMEEKLNVVNEHCTVEAMKDVKIMNVKLETAGEISELIESRTTIFTTPNTPSIIKKHVLDEFKLLTAYQVYNL
jgi:uncharacterized protein YfkK (UPF0435 family)